MKTLIDKNGWVVRVSEELAPRMIAKGYQYCPKSKWKTVSGLTPLAVDVAEDSALIEKIVKEISSAGGVPAKYFGNATKA